MNAQGRNAHSLISGVHSFEDDGTYLRLSTPFVSSYVDSVLIYTNIRTSSYLMTELVALGAV